MIDKDQARAARSFLDWSQRDLARESKLPLSAIKAFESGRDIRVSILSAIEKALTDAGILFLDDGDTRSGGRGLRLRS